MEATALQVNNKLVSTNEGDFRAEEVIIALGRDSASYTGLGKRSS